MECAYQLTHLMWTPRATPSRLILAEDFQSFQVSQINEDFMSRRVTRSVNSLQLLAVSWEQGRQDWAHL